jgi:hypothetical protein
MIPIVRISVHRVPLRFYKNEDIISEIKTNRDRHEEELATDAQNDRNIDKRRRLISDKLLLFYYQWPRYSIIITSSGRHWKLFSLISPKNAYTVKSSQSLKLK